MSVTDMVSVTKNTKVKKFITELGLLLTLVRSMITKCGCYARLLRAGWLSPGMLCWNGKNELTPSLRNIL